MARQFSEAEIQAFVQAEAELKQLGLHVSNQDERGVNNGKVLGQYFAANPQVVVTKDSIVSAATTTLRNELNWKSAAQTKADNAAASLTQQEVDTILAWVPTRGLLADGDNLLNNFGIVANWMTQNHRTISYSELDLALTRSLTLTPAGSGLRWVKKLQDSEKEAQRQREEAAKVPSTWKEKTSVSTIPELTLSPQMQAHREMLHRSDNKPAAAPEVSEAEWKQRAEASLSNTNLDRDRKEAARYFPGNMGVTSWQDAYKKRVQYLEKRKVERSNAGR